jgi:hypothetical protein
MEHIVFNEKVDIEWEQVELGENHRSGYTEWLLEGHDKEDNIYTAVGYYQNDELTDIVDIEKL